MKNVVIGSLKKWSRVALEWNLDNDSEFGTHTPGGCPECKGALTITDTSITRNVAYYIIAHASRFILPGSIRIASSDVSGISNVAFKRPDGKIIVLVLNEGENKIEFNVAHDTRAHHVSLDGHAVASILF
jgi:glucosylceramidase